MIYLHIEDWVVAALFVEALPCHSLRRQISIIGTQTNPRKSSPAEPGEYKHSPSQHKVHCYGESVFVCLLLTWTVPSAVAECYRACRQPGPSLYNAPLTRDGPRRARSGGTAADAVAPPVAALPGTVVFISPWSVRVTAAGSRGCRRGGRRGALCCGVLRVARGGKGRARWRSG